MGKVVLATTVTCPACGDRFEATMPTDACVQMLPCPACGHVLRREGEACCVFCTHAEDRCPPEQGVA